MIREHANFNVLVNVNNMVIYILDHVDVHSKIILMEFNNSIPSYWVTGQHFGSVWA